MASLSLGSAAAGSETLGSPAALFTIPSGAELLGLTPCLEKDAVVISTQNSGVTVQNVSLAAERDVAKKSLLWLPSKPVAHTACRSISAILCLT
jgi:hypothetical protein